MGHRLRPRSPGERQNDKGAECSGHFHTRVPGLGSGYFFTQPARHPSLDRVIAMRGKPERIRMDNGLNATSFLVTAIDLLRSPKLATFRHKLPNDQGTPVVFHEDWETR